MSTCKKRNWAFVLYPESAPPDWRERLSLYGVPCAISPLHDRDLQKDGTLKKPHFHIILSFKSPTTYNNVKSFVDSLSQPIPIPLQDLGSYFRYLWHADNSEKAQYFREDVVFLCGFKEPREKLDSDECVLGLFAFIRDNQITDYSYLVDVLSDTNQVDLLSYCVSHAYAVVSYLRSAVSQ